MGLKLTVGDVRDAGPDGAVRSASDTAPGKLALRLPSPLRLWLVIGGLAVLLLALVTPPFEVGDENQHMIRAYRVSEGTILPDHVGGQVGWLVPASIPKAVETIIGKPGMETGFQIRHTPPDVVLKELRRPLDPAAKVLFPIHGHYFPAAYVPPAAGIAVGRVFGLSPVCLLYAARLANGLAALSLVAWALRIMPTAQPVALAIALLPSSLQAFASASSDASVIAASILFAAVAMRAALGLRTGWAAIAAFILLGVTKYAYAPFTFAAGVTSRRDRLLQLGLGVAACAMAVGWMKLGAVGFREFAGGSSIAGQSAVVLHDPVRFLDLATRTLLLESPRFFGGFLGRLAWGELLLPTPTYIILYLGLCVSVMAPMAPARVARWQLLIWVLAGICVTYVILLALYIDWTWVGANRVLGVQGRYFLPIAPLVGCGIASRLSAIPAANFREAAGMMSLGASLVGVITTIAMIALSLWTWAPAP